MITWIKNYIAHVTEGQSILWIIIGILAWLLILTYFNACKGEALNFQTR
jgi:hypothetical protein